MPDTGSIICDPCFAHSFQLFPISSDSMQVDSEPRSKRISTHGARNSRREEWRKSKGMVARPARSGMNRQGGVAARRKGGRSSRRR